MPPVNDFVPFCPTVTGTNLLTQAQYLADAQLAIGNQPGVARSKLVNKALRQSTYMAACLAQFIANVSGDNVLDDENTANVLISMFKTFKKAPTVTNILAGAGVYTLPAAVAYIRVKMVGGGAGGNGQSGGGGGIGGNGNDTLFGTGLLVASGAISSIPGGASLGVGPIGFTRTGGHGGIGVAFGAIQSPGGFGGDTPFSGTSYGGYGAAAGLAASANSGGGGGGGGSAAGIISGSGGGGGGSLEAIIDPSMVCWAPTFNYTIGTGGAGGAAGSGTPGGAGADGRIIVEEFY